MHRVKRILIGLGVLYLGILVAFIGGQRSLIYFPSRDSNASPSDHGLAFEDVRIKSTDSISLHAWWLAHPGGVVVPTLLYCHGNGGSLASYPHVTKIFYDYGWNLLMFDYRGYGQSDKAPLTEQGLFTDAQAAYDWLRSRGIPEGGIIIWGHSLGSAVAAELSSRNRPAGLVLESPFPSVYEMGRVLYPWLALMPWMVWDRFETAHYVTRRKMPLLVIHGAGDITIPPELGRAVFERAAEPKEWLMIPEINHTGFPSVQDRYRDKLQSFAKRVTGL